MIVDVCLLAAFAGWRRIIRAEKRGSPSAGLIFNRHYVENAGQAGRCQTTAVPTIITALRQYSLPGWLAGWLNIDPYLKALSNGNYRNATTTLREAFVDNSSSRINTIIWII